MSLCAEAKASRVPSGPNAMASTGRSWPARVRTCVPVAVSHSRTVQSELPETSRVPSGLNATPRTALVRPVEGADLCTTDNLPQPHCPVIPSRGEKCPVRAEGQAHHPAGAIAEVAIDAVDELGQ